MFGFVACYYTRSGEVVFKAEEAQDSGQVSLWMAQMKEEGGIN